MASKHFDVVDRKNIEKLLAEQEFQLSECTDSSCAVKIGQVLALDKMTYCSVSKLGDTFIINLQLLSVGSAQIEASSRERALFVDAALGATAGDQDAHAGRRLQGPADPHQ